MKIQFRKFIKILYNIFILITFLTMNSSVLAQEGVDFGVTVHGSIVGIDAPVIIRSENITTNTLDLIVDVDNAYAGDVITFLLQVKDLFTGEITNVNYTQDTDINARTSLAVTGLMSGTEYEFMVVYTPDNLIYSEQSLSHRAITVINPPIIENIYDIKNKSVKLLTTIDPDFINSTMDFIVEIRNGGTHTVQLTQYVTGQSITLPIDDLESETDYTFRVKYARENTPNFSEYSNEKSITTDSEEKNEKLKAPVVIDIRDITTNSMRLVIETEGRAQEKLDFIAHITNMTTGKIVATEFTKIVNEDDAVNFYVGGLDSDTEYEFKVKYSPEDTSDYSSYSDPRRERTKGLELEDVLICYNEVTMWVASVDLQTYLNEGATEDECIIENNAQVEICYKKHTILIEQNNLQTYIDDGATQGKCPVIFNDEKVEVCYEGETIWVKLTSQIYQNAKPGKCNKNVIINKDELRKVIIPEEKVSVYQGLAITGAGAGVIIASATSAVPFFIAMPGSVSSFAMLQFIKLFGIIWPRRKKEKWGMIFEKKTHLPIPAVKIILLDENREKIMTTYSDKNGRFGFVADPGKYFLRIVKKSYSLVTEVKNDELYDKIYNGKSIIIDENRVMKTVNIAMKAKKIDWAKYGNIKSGQYVSVSAKLRRNFFLLLYIIGFCATLLVTYFYPVVFNFVILGLYSILFLFTIFFKKRKYGFIQTSLGKPVPFAIVSLYDKILKEKHTFTVTDPIGRYYLRTDNGAYDLKVKSQEVSGVKFNKKEDVFVKDGIVRKKIII